MVVSLDCFDVQTVLYQQYVYWYSSVYWFKTFTIGRLGNGTTPEERQRRQKTRPPGHKDCKTLSKRIRCRRTEISRAAQKMTKFQAVHPRPTTIAPISQPKGLQGSFLHELLRDRFSNTGKNRNEKWKMCNA